MHADPASPLFRSWVRLVVSTRWVWLFLTLAITLFFAQAAATKLRFDGSVGYFSAGDPELSAALAAWEDSFGADEQHLVLVRGEVFSPDFLVRLAALHAAMEAMTVEGVGPAAQIDDWGELRAPPVAAEVQSLINAPRMRSGALGLTVERLLDPMPAPEELARVRAEVLADPSLVGNLIGPEADHTVIALRSRAQDDPSLAQVNRALKVLVAAHVAPGFEPRVTGLPDLNDHLNTTIEADTQRLVGASLLVMSVILFLVLRNPLAVLGSLGVVTLASVWTLGAMALTDTPVTLLSNVIPAFLACVGMGDSVHIQAVYRDRLAAGDARLAAIEAAVGSTGLPVVFTTLTTAAGLLSFRFASTQAVQEMGTFGALGVMAALLHSLVFLPVWLSWAPIAGKRAEVRAPDLTDRLLAACTAASASPRGRRAVLSSFALFVALGGVGIAQLRLYHNPLDWLPSGDPTREGLLALDRSVGGTSTVHLLVEAAPRTLHDPALVAGLAAVEADARAWVHPTRGERIVSSTLSPLDFLRQAEGALRGTPSLPASPRALSDDLFLLESAAPDQLGRLATADLGTTRLSLRVRWMDASSYLPLRDALQTSVDQHLQGLARVRPTGSVYSLLVAVGALVGDLLRSFGSAVLVITLMMITLLRDSRLGLISMAPNLVPIVGILGFMGFVGIPIDMSNLLIASIVIGVAVDDTIHYLHQYRAARRSGLGTEAAITHALDHAGRAMVGTSLVLAAGFGVFLVSGMISLQRFGLLIAAASALALFVDLLLTPALLRALDSDGSHAA